MSGIGKGNRNARQNSGFSVRKKKIAIIHAEKRRLALDDATYRAALQAATATYDRRLGEWALGKASCAHMTDHELYLVINWFRKKHPCPHGSEWDQTRLRWKAKNSLIRAGISEASIAAYLDGMAAKMFAGASFAVLTAAQLHKLVAACEVYRQRHAPAD